MELQLGRQVRRLREEKGLTQVQLAVLADLSPTVVNQVESGKREPNATTLRKLAAALEVEIPDLFSRADPPKVPSRSSSEASVLSDEERLARAAHHFLRLTNNATVRGELLEEKLKDWPAGTEYPVGDIAALAEDWLALSWMYENAVNTGGTGSTGGAQEERAAKRRLDGVLNRIEKLLSQHPARVLSSSQRKEREKFRQTRAANQQHNNKETIAQDSSGRA